VNDANATTSKSAKKSDDSTKQRASRKVEDGSNCRTDKPSSNVESRTVKFDEETSGAQLFPSIGFKIERELDAKAGTLRQNAWGWQSRKPAK
jgi:hypothetical protein